MVDLVLPVGFFPLAATIVVAIIVMYVVTRKS